MRRLRIEMDVMDVHAEHFLAKPERGSVQAWQAVVTTDDIVSVEDITPELRRVRVLTLERDAADDHLYAYPTPETGIEYPFLGIAGWRVVSCTTREENA